MREKNASLPESERLDLDEFNLDKEQLKSLRRDQEDKQKEVREEARLENLAQQYLAYQIKVKCWDDMHVKGNYY